MYKLHKRTEYLASFQASVTRMGWRSLRRSYLFESKPTANVFLLKCTSLIPPFFEIPLWTLSLTGDCSILHDLLRLLPVCVHVYVWRRDMSVLLYTPHVCVFPILYNQTQLFKCHQSSFDVRGRALKPQQPPSMSWGWAGGCFSDGGSWGNVFSIEWRCESSAAAVYLSILTRLYSL